MSCLSEITNLPLSKPIEIEHIGFVWQGQRVVISISQILVSGGYCDFPRFVQIFVEKECTFTVPTQFESSLYSIFVRPGSICNSNKTLYPSFFIYTFKSTTKNYAPLYVYSMIFLRGIYNMIYKYNDLKIIRLNSKKLNQIMFY